MPHTACLTPPPPLRDCDKSPPPHKRRRIRRTFAATQHLGNHGCNAGDHEQSEPVKGGRHQQMFLGGLDVPGGAT
jgi:hypothetical protein